MPSWIGCPPRFKAISICTKARVSVGVTESRASAAQAEAVTEQLVLVALVFGLGLAAIASYTILRPLRQLQGHIKQIGQGNFGESLQITAPAELRSWSIP